MLLCVDFCGGYCSFLVNYSVGLEKAGLRVNRDIGGELYESVGVEAPSFLSYTHKNEWNTHGGLPTRCQRSAMGVSLIFVGVRQQNGCFDTNTFIQLSTYEQRAQPGR